MFYNQNNVADLDFFFILLIIFDKKKISVIIFGNVTILNAPSGFKLMTNALTHYAITISGKKKKT